MTDEIEAVRIRLHEAGLRINLLGGRCPVQAEGSFGSDLQFYFRSRGASWEFHLYPTGSSLFDDDIFVHEEDYGEWPEAGFISELQALQFIEKALETWANLEENSND